MGKSPRKGKPEEVQPKKARKEGKPRFYATALSCFQEEKAKSRVV
jgi:hypothetical protein